MAEDVSDFPKGHVTKELQATKELQMSLTNSKVAVCLRDSSITMKDTAKNQDSVARA